MNATVQALRAIPELQTALAAPHATNASPTPLPRALATLYTSMSRTTDAVMPMAFLQVLRGVVPQFGEIDRRGGFAGYAQQDAEECWGKITEALKDIPLEAGSETSSKKFVEAYMTGQMRREYVLVYIQNQTNIKHAVQTQMRRSP
jgi:ubiquitin carboxyl-terminal hydrolase 14